MTNFTTPNYDTTFTIKVFKLDRRLKEGKKCIIARDIEPTTAVNLDDVRFLLEASGYTANKYEVEVAKTYVEVVSAFDGRKVMERYDTKFHCSVASESYWCS